MSRDAIKKKILSVYPHIFPVLLFITLEIQNTANVYGNIPAVFITSAMLYVSLWILFALAGRVFISGILISLALLAFYTANFYRMMQTGHVLLPNDLNLARHIGSIFAFSNLSLHWRPICSLLCTAALHVPLFHASKRIRCNIGRRAAIFAISGAISYLSFFSQFSQEQVLYPLIFNDSAKASYNDIYKEQGALLGFYAVGIAGDANMPEGYSRAHMEALALSVLNNAAGCNSDESIKPNVIGLRYFHCGRRLAGCSNERVIERAGNHI